MQFWCDVFFLYLMLFNHFIYPIIGTRAVGGRWNKIKQMKKKQPNSQSAINRTIIQSRKFEFADQFCLCTTILPNKRAEMFESLFVFLKQIRKTKKIGPNQKNQNSNSYFWRIPCLKNSTESVKNWWQWHLPPNVKLCFTSPMKTGKMTAHIQKQSRLHGDRDKAVHHDVCLHWYKGKYWSEK